MDPSVLGRWEDRGNWGNGQACMGSSPMVINDPMGKCEEGKPSPYWKWRKKCEEAMDIAESNDRKNGVIRWHTRLHCVLLCANFYSKIEEGRSR